MPLAYIALGANLGDRRANIESAIERLRNTPGVAVTKVSSLLETPAVGGPPDSPPFLNAAAEIATTLSPRELLDRLLEIEHQLGRQRREKWGPRIIDLDLLLFGDQIIAEPNLQIPHPLMHERRFVLEPLAEIAGHLVHPVLRLSIDSLFAELRDTIPGNLMPQVTTTGFTIDTSALIAVLGNEALKPRILELTRDHELVAPPTLPWEVVNAFSAMFKRRVVDLPTALNAVELFERIPIRLVPVALPAVISLAHSLNIYAYDACMIACSLETGFPLLTLDGGLRDAARRAKATTVEVSP